MRETLVRYVLGELGEEERRAVESRLAADTQLRRELEQIRACLDPGDHDPADPPRDLADRTAACISQLPSDDPAGAAAFDRVDPPAHCSRVTFVDACVAIGVVFAVGMMLLPALGESRARSRRTTCENNMRVIGTALRAYSFGHGGYFPYIGPNDNAGMFAVRLAESGVISREELSRRLFCSDSPASRKQASVLVVVVPRRAELDRANGAVLFALRRDMGGRYGYRVGYVKDGRYHAVRNHSSSRAPILSDAPSSVDNRWVSLNHGGNGQNVLFQDGGVRYLTEPRGMGLDDNLFTNAAGEVSAGRGANDAVLMRSEMTPRLGRAVVPVVPGPLRPTIRDQ